jgi:uncharacterized protein with ParB-like and HNH nuclease domain
MHYQSETIATVLKRLNVNYFLPAIQREYVWSPEQIIQLFDSLMRNYPISSFLFWELHAENRYRWDVYKFIQNYKQDESHNEPTRTDGVQQLTLILDGQQRLTSLFIGLKGTYTIKKKYLRWDNPDAWVKQSLYLDLLKDPKTSEDDSEEGLRFDFRFMDKAPSPDGKSYWFNVGHILDFDGDDKFYEFRDQEEEKLPEATTKHQIKLFQQNLDRLYRAIWKDDFIAYYAEQDQNYDRVLTIFVRANQGGTKLSKSDLLLSMVTAKWDAVNARDEIYEFVDRLNNDLTHKNNFDKDFIMKTCLVLSDLPVQYKVENFNYQNLMLIYSKWKRIKAAIERSVNLINSFGVDRDTLTSANALIPVIYYLYQHPEVTLLGSTPFEVSNATHIHRWLLMALLNNTFSGQSDTALTYARRIVAEHNQEQGFPDEAMNAELRRSGRKASIDDDTVDTILSFTYGKPLTFLALSLLYDDNRWGNFSYQQDHIFPQALFTAKRMKSIGISAERQIRYFDLVNRVGNLELLLPVENLEKSSQDFEHWVATRDFSFRMRHLIPDEENLLAFDKFEEFIAAREELIRQRLKAFFALPASQGSASSIRVPPEMPGDRQGLIHLSLN